MPAADPQELFDSLKSAMTVYGAMAIGGGVIALALWRFAPGGRGPLFPPQRQHAAPWMLSHVLLMTVLFFGLPMVANTILLEAGVGELTRVALQRLLADPVVLVCYFLVLRYAAGALPYQVGFTLQRPVKDLLAGYLVWLVVTPICLLVFYALLHVEKSEDHPIKKLLAKEADVAIWITLAVSVLILAPLVEEVLFRGVIQPWMVQEPALADLTMLIAIVTWIIYGAGLHSIWPLVCLAAAAPGYLAFEWLTRRWLPRPGAARAIFATSLLFAAIHYQVWPSPIPLFFFALGAGYLSYRTQSLMGPIFLHACFNLVSYVDLVMK
jgi:membrane protease YdiL (CAAX protease family)